MTRQIDTRPLCLRIIKSMITTGAPQTHTILPALPIHAASIASLCCQHRAYRATGTVAWHSTSGLMQCTAFSWHGAVPVA